MAAKHRTKYTRLVGAFRNNDVILANDNSSSSNNEEEKSIGSTLGLMMISCEDNPPYGPSENTAKMFLDLLEIAYLATDHHTSRLEITITVYEAKQKDYPSTDQEWQNYDGILLPGSFSSAYEKEDWIERLKEVIQTEIHGKGRKTMAVCFGHQVFAHSFSGKDSCNGAGAGAGTGGLAVPCPASIQVGHFQFKSTNMKWLSRHNTQDSPINILYTHGDMVESLPECAISLGGTDTVPIQAAVYFQKKSEEDQTPYAYTFQGHPEYVTNTGIKTFYNVLEAMNEKGKVSDESLMKTKKSCLEMFGIVEEDSIFVMKEVAKTFKWF